MKQYHYIIIITVLLLYLSSPCPADSTNVEQNEANKTEEIQANYVQKVCSFFRSAQTHGLWDFLTFCSVVFGAFMGYRYFFYSKSNIKNLNIKKWLSEEKEDNTYPLKIRIEIRNYTGQSVVIFDSFFILKKFKPDPKASMDEQTGRIETRYPSKYGQIEVDYLIRHKESVETWIPLEPNQNIDEIKKTLKESFIGRFYFSCNWVGIKPKLQKLERKI